MTMKDVEKFLMKYMWYTYLMVHGGKYDKRDAPMMRSTLIANFQKEHGIKFEATDDIHGIYKKLMDTGVQYAKN